MVIQEEQWRLFLQGGEADFHPVWKSGRESFSQPMQHPLAAIVLSGITRRYTPPLHQLKLYRSRQTAATNLQPVRISVAELMLCHNMAFILCIYRAQRVELGGWYEIGRRLRYYNQSFISAGGALYLGALPLLSPRHTKPTSRNQQRQKPTAVLPQATCVMAKDLHMNTPQRLQTTTNQHMHSALA